MAKDSIRSQIYSFANNMVAAVLFAGVAMIATILYTHYGPTWVSSIAKGLVAFFCVLASFMVVRIMLALPLARERITVENIESKLLEWLHKFHLTITNHPLSEAHFCVQVTVNEKHLFIGRAKGEWSDYLELWAWIKEADEEEKKIITSLTLDQISWITINLKVELARARIGYTGFGEIGQSYRINKRIPITESLTEERVINAVWEIEATLNTLYYSVVKDIHLAKAGKLP